MPKSISQFHSVDPTPAFPAVDNSAANRRKQPGAVQAALAARLRGPGGVYNLGNVIGLSTGIALQFAAALGQGEADTVAVLQSYFFGSPGASWLTLAIAIFLISGEVYHRAWQNGAPPDMRLNRSGDLLSCLGAAALTVSLVYFGDVLLAIVSGTLLAGGKLGTAILPETYGAPKAANRLPTLFRNAVIVSRAPAILALSVQLFGLFSTSGGAIALADVVAPAVMLLCYFIWLRADLMLLAAGGDD